MTSSISKMDRACSLSNAGRPFDEACRTAGGQSHCVGPRRPFTRTYPCQSGPTVRALTFGIPVGRSRASAAEQNGLCGARGTTHLRQTRSKQCSLLQPSMRLAGSGVSARFTHQDRILICNFGCHPHREPAHDAVVVNRLTDRASTHCLPRFWRGSAIVVRRGCHCRATRPR